MTLPVEPSQASWASALIRLPHNGEQIGFALGATGGFFALAAAIVFSARNTG